MDDGDVRRLLRVQLSSDRLKATISFLPSYAKLLSYQYSTLCSLRTVVWIVNFIS